MMTIETPWADADPYPSFDRRVPDSGYAWWYVDAISDDGEQAITLIAFVGSVFSPYYAFARRRQPAPAARHCALNVAIYQPHGSRWTMTERDGTATTRQASRYRLGPSDVRWDGESLRFTIDERSAPTGQAVRGTVVLHPGAMLKRRYSLDADQKHWWQPVATDCRIEVDLQAPRVRWQGQAYMDANFGSEPLACAFSQWTWMRAMHDEGTIIHYVVQSPQGLMRNISLLVRPDASVESLSLPPRVDLPRTRWQLEQWTYSDPGTRCTVVRSLEDTPFYARAELDLSLMGRPVRAIHEFLSLKRFTARWVQAMLPFRMPRRSQG